MKAHGLFRTIVSFLLDFQPCFHVMRTLFFFTGDTVTEIVKICKRALHIIKISLQSGLRLHSTRPKLDLV